MAEYLSPGVYIEEIELGAKPIEGVSTSTAGFLGMAEKGSLDKPTLVTNFGEYQRVFGGYLDKNRFEKTWYLPYAIQSFFENGGGRAYITRVADTTTETTKAKKSTGFLPDISGSEIALSEEATPKNIMMELDSVTELETDDILLIKDDKNSEFVKFKSLAKKLTLDTPVNSSYLENTNITKQKIGTLGSTIVTEIDAGVSIFDVVDASSFEIGHVLFIDDENQNEICTITAIDNNEITVQNALQYAHDGSTTAIDITKLDDSTEVTQVLSNIKSGYSSIPIDVADADFSTDNVIKIGSEYFIISSNATNIALLSEELKYKHTIDTPIKKLAPAIELTASSEGSWGDRIKVSTIRSMPTKISVIEKDIDYIDVESVAGVYNGTILKLNNDYREVKEVINTPDLKRVIMTENLPATFNTKDPVETEEFNLLISSDKSEETFTNLSLNENHPNYIEHIQSKLITVKVTTTGTSIVMPSQDKTTKWYWKLEGGVDGIPTEDDINTVYVGKLSDTPESRTGLYTFENIDGINIVAIPGMTSQYIQKKIISHCEKMKNRFGVLDSIKGANLEEIQKQRNLYDSKYAALYYPWVEIYNPLTKKNDALPPSGHVIGVYARSDTERGVHKAPANEKLNNVMELSQIITKGQQDILNPKGVNCIRAFPGRGIRIWGARTLSSDPLWKYINVRRLFLYMEESIDEGTQWVVFEPNSEILWARVIQTISNFLKSVWKSGALMGTTPEEAFFVKCDKTTMTDDDIANGRLIVLIGVAPVKPAEFVIFRIAQSTNNADQ